MLRLCDGEVEGKGEVEGDCEIEGKGNIMHCTMQWQIAVVKQSDRIQLHWCYYTHNLGG